MNRRSFLATIAAGIAAPAVRAEPFFTSGDVLKLAFVKPPAGGLTPFAMFAIWDAITLEAGLSITEEKGGRPWPFFGAPAPAQFFLERMSIDFPDSAAALEDISELFEAAEIRLGAGGRTFAEQPLFSLGLNPPGARVPPASLELPLWPTWAVDEGFKVELAARRPFELERPLTVRTTLYGYIDANLLAPGQK